MNSLDKIREAGIVGAGGAGFPTHVKLNTKAEIIIANGVECEPLLRVDQQVMGVETPLVIQGLQLSMSATGASKGVICLKGKYTKAIEKLEQYLSHVKEDITLAIIDSYYPAGDEQALVYEVTKKVVPTGGIPIAAGAVVLNVSTLLNIAKAMTGEAVFRKYVTVTGEVATPKTLLAPIGTPISRLILEAGGVVNKENYSLILGGPAMGQVTDDWEQAVTKTLGGIIVLPKTHSLIQKKTAPLDFQIKLARSVCCQCNQCTMLCPRKTLGLSTSPHKAMRALAYGCGQGIEPEEVVSCCECGVCSYFACPMGLAPSRVMGKMKAEFLQKKIPFEKTKSIGVSEIRTFKNLPTTRLVNRLGLKSYDKEAPLESEELSVTKVNIPLKQHIGAPSIPIVKVGQKVEKGEKIATIPEGALGANVHGSISGIVSDIDDRFIGINKTYIPEE